MTTDNVAEWYETEYIHACQSLAQARAELAQAHIELRQIRKLWLNPAEAAQIRAELAAVDESLGEFYCPVLDSKIEEPYRPFWKDHGVHVMRKALDHAEAALVLSTKALVQSRTELKDLQDANRALARQVDNITDNREFWCKKAQDAEAERDKLEKELAHTQRQLAAANAAAEWLWGYYDGNTLMAKPGYEDDINEAWGKLLVAADSTPDAIQLQERLAMLDAVEATLADCGIGGIYAEFDTPADAIAQMDSHIKELSSRLTQAQADLDAEPIEVEITGKEIVQALQAEHRLRQKAEHYVETLKDTMAGIHEALDECQVRKVYVGDGCPASAQTRIFWLNQRAEKAEGCAFDNAIAASTYKHHLKDRTERAGALAQLVTEEMAGLLERLGAAWVAGPEDKTEAHTLAAKIREVLDDSQA